MRIFKRLAPVIILIALFLAGNQLLNYLVIPYDFTRVKVHELETNAYGTLLIGTSHMASAIDPDLLTEDGTRCYNAAVGGMYACENYYLLQDAVRSHKPERVILEYDPTYWIDAEGQNANARYLLSCMRLSPVKLRYFLATCLQNDFRYTFMPWYMNRAHIRNVKETLRIKQSDDYRQYGTEAFTNSFQEVKTNGWIAIYDESYTEGEVSSYAYEEERMQKNRSYFLKTLDYCKENGIETVVVSTPVPEEMLSENRAFYEQSIADMQSIADARGIRYLDYIIEKQPDLGDAAFSDVEGHLRRSAAEAFSRILREDLE